MGNVVFIDQIQYQKLKIKLGRNDYIQHIAIEEDKTGGFHRISAIKIWSTIGEFSIG